MGQVDSWLWLGTMWNRCETQKDVDDASLNHCGYRDLLAAGLAANPPATQHRPGQRGRLAQSPARKLPERLILGQEQVLANCLVTDEAS
jgi:hypothetical protein